MLAVTGANGHLGSRLVGARGDAGVRALVRSRRAADQVCALDAAAGVDVRVVDYARRDALAAALEGCAAVIHLVGILKESRTSRYVDAHQASCTALAAAAADAGLGSIVYLSIVGARPDTPNACLASKGEAEQILLDGRIPATVIRVPMVLGEGDYASRALAARARRRLNLVLRAASLEQPIYAGDVVAAMTAAAARRQAGAFDLAGPESLTRAALIRRAAAVLGRRTRVVSLPLGLGLALAALVERVSADPPVTRAMLEVLDHDDVVDTGPAVQAFRLASTPLDETLRRCIGNVGAP